MLQTYISFIAAASNTSFQSHQPNPENSRRILFLIEIQLGLLANDALLLNLFVLVKSISTLNYTNMKWNQIE